MKLFGFSFKSEPIWMLAFSLGPAVLGLLALLVVLILKHGRRSIGTDQEVQSSTRGSAAARVVAFLVVLFPHAS